MQNTAGPTILKTPDLSQAASNISKNPRGFFKRNLIIIVIAVLVIAVLAELYFGVFALFSPSGKSNFSILQPQVNEFSSAQISLIPDRTSYKTGDTVSVRVKLYTGGYTTGSTDLVVKYDPAFLRTQGENFASVGQIYAEYPPAQVDEKNGLIGISGIPMSNSEGFSGVGEFAKLNFIALKEGQTQVTVDFQENQTADTNVVLIGGTKDILGTVENAGINISAAAVVGDETKPESCGSFTQYCQDGTGKVGTQVCNAGTIKNSTCGYDSGLTTSCEACKIE